jgi:type IV secretion system protein VirB10
MPASPCRRRDRHACRTDRPQPEEQRRAQEREAARNAKPASTETRPATSVATAATTPQTDPRASARAAAGDAQHRQLAFLNQTPDKRTVSPDRVAAPASANVLQAGADLRRAHHRHPPDLPGQITAQVTENVYDSPTGKILLVPQGTRSSASMTAASASGSAASCSSGTG